MVAGDNMEYELIPDFLLVKNRVPLSPEQLARLKQVQAKAPPPLAQKYAETERAYRASIERDKALKAAIAAPAREAFFAAKKADAAEVKAVKEEARKVHATRRRKKSY
jgi:hypothetical protein